MTRPKSPTVSQAEAVWRYYADVLGRRYARATMASVLAAACLAVYARESPVLCPEGEWCAWSLIPSIWMLVCLAAAMQACGTFGGGVQRG